MKNIRVTILSVLAVAATVGALWLTNNSVTPKEATWADVEAEAESGGYRLISTDEVWQQYRKNRESLLLVDTRQKWEYRTGHIRGAVNFPMEPTWLARWQKKAELAKLLGEDRKRFIVFY